MDNLVYTKHERISLKLHPVLNERWVQERIAEDPTILGLGDLVLKDKERIQPRAGRLDLLLQDALSNDRYEVEIQLGQTDESHIIRTIEYWDIERRRYPQYEHTAVLVAEDITSRFLNVINLFNGHIPLIAIQLSAMRVGNHLSLVCTRVLDRQTLGFEDEDDEVQEVTDRAYWEQRGTKQTVAMADELVAFIRSFDPQVSPKYNKFHIGLERNKQPNNFAAFRPKKNALRLEVRLPESDDVQDRLEQAGLDVMDYDKRRRMYRIRLVPSDIKKQEALLTEILKQAHELATA